MLEWLSTESSLTKSLTKRVCSPLLASLELSTLPWLTMSPSLPPVGLRRAKDMNESWLVREDLIVQVFKQIQPLQTTVNTSAGTCKIGVWNSGNRNQTINSSVCKRHSNPVTSIKLANTNFYTFKNRFSTFKSHSVSCNPSESTSCSCWPEINQFQLTYYLISQALVGSALNSLSTA